jgi:hypothetical protein
LSNSGVDIGIDLGRLAWLLGSLLSGASRFRAFLAGFSGVIIVVVFIVVLGLFVVHFVIVVTLFLFVLLGVDALSELFSSGVSELAFKIEVGSNKYVVIVVDI